MDTATPLVLFANPRSGSTLAAEYLQLPDHKADLTLSCGPVPLLVFNILDPPDKLRGFQVVRDSLCPDSIVRVFIAGGDGSLIWMLQDLIQEGIPLDLVAVSTLPFGTGNDLAAMLGWGRKPTLPLLGKQLCNLTAQAELWTKAVVGSLDLWDIDMTVQQGGFFLKVERLKKGFKKTVLSDETGAKTRFRRLMSNYFSMGVDARIGLGFDKMRTRSQKLNKAVYAWEGLKKLCCLPVSDIQDFIQSFEEIDGDASRTIFDRETEALGSTYVTVIAQNIRNYAASDHHLWDTARGQVNPSLIPEEQSASDGLLEFIVFPAGYGMALEQLIQGNSLRLHQGKGQFRFRCAPRPQTSVYMNVDGEYFAAVGLQEVTIALSPYSHQLQVMRAQGAEE